MGRSCGNFKRLILGCLLNFIQKSLQFFRFPDLSPLFKNCSTLPKSLLIPTVGSFRGFDKCDKDLFKNAYRRQI
jgi:hypothetical protein